MSSITSFEHALADSLALTDIARQADVTPEAARRLAAALAALPIVQVIRICTTAQNDQARRRARQQRRGR